MKNSALIDALTNFGLSDHEAQVYFAALSLGPTTVLNIARSALIKRTTAYSVIESLKQKGLMNVEIRGLKKFYVAENPEKLEKIMEYRKGIFKDLLPEFTAIYNLKTGQGFIKYYEGLESIKSIYENLLKDIRPHEDYMILSDTEKWVNADKEYFMDFTRRRGKLPINIRLVLQDTPTARQFQKQEKNYNYRIKLLPKNTVLNTNLVVIPKRVVIHQLTPPVLAIIIENKNVIQMHKEMFEIIWRSIPDQNKTPD